MFPVELLVRIIKLSSEPVALKVMSVFNIKKWELFIDMLVEKHEYDNMIVYEVYGLPHYRYGPAVVFSNGSRAWYINNKLHRLDGPAIEGIEESRWYKNGLLHRETNEYFENVTGNEYFENITGNEYFENVTGNEYFQNVGPAIIRKDGSMEWYKNGKLHRLDGPAVMDVNNIRRGWYYEGKRHRGVVGNEDSRNPGPAIEYYGGKKEWYQNGLLHRLDGPAIEIPGEDGIWYKDGKLHRDGDPEIIGPTIVIGRALEWYQNGIIQKRVYKGKKDNYTEWYENGKLCRLLDNRGIMKHYRDGALYQVDIPTGMVVQVSYKDGYVHSDGPAIIYEDGTMEWYKNGLEEVKEDKGIRKEWQIDGNTYKIIELYGKKVWYKNGKIHRDDGPAVCNEYEEGWYQNGLLHREVAGNDYSVGPAIIHSDGTREWYQNGLLHRLDGPAIEYPDGCYAWYKNGVLHRDGKDSGPTILANTVIMLDDIDLPTDSKHDKGVMEWYKNGLLHRLNGPAICSKESGKRWYIEGCLCLSQ